VVELPWAADSCPWVEKLRTVLPLTVAIRDSAVHLVSILGSAVISARAELGSIITSALPVATVLTHQLQRVGGGDKHLWRRLHRRGLAMTPPAAEQPVHEPARLRRTTTTAAAAVAP
jgi:hypothetical protein